MAPELVVDEEEEDLSLRRGYSPFANDVWSLGIILINLLFGKNPWSKAALSDPIYHAYIYTNPNILQDNFKLSSSLHYLMKQVLDPNPRTRISLSRLQEEFNRIQVYFEEASTKPQPVSCDDDLDFTVYSPDPAFDTFDPYLFPANTTKEQVKEEPRRVTSVVARTESTCFSPITEGASPYSACSTPFSTPATPRDILFSNYAEHQGKRLFDDMPLYEEDPMNMLIAPFQTFFA